ncbi:Pvc16 family protein [Hymenobacter sp. HD11105]
MSTLLGIAAVTHLLKDMLNDGLPLVEEESMGIINAGTQITALPPDRIVLTGPNPHVGLNLFLYQVRPNQGWRNQGLPALDDQGLRVRNPPLALDLHYFLTAYGGEELHAETLLGYGMQLFHATPVLSRDALRNSPLARSELAEQVEQIKITPESLSADDMSRLWTAFQAAYRLTVPYLVTVVLIQLQKSTRTALPVLQRQITALPFRHPLIDHLKSQAPAVGSRVEDNQLILTGHKVFVIGQQLNHGRVGVTIDGESVTLDSVSDSQLTFTVPDTLPAGIHGLQVVQRVAVEPLAPGEPPAPEYPITSNLLAFVLSPTLGVATYAPGSVGDADLRSGALTLPVAPAVLASQRVVVLLNEVGTTAGLAYSFRRPIPEPDSLPAQTVVVPVTNVKPGSYLVRLQVDGAESSLTTDGADRINRPPVTIS